VGFKTPAKTPRTPHTPAAVRSPHERPIATPRRRSTPAAGVKPLWRSRAGDPSAEKANGEAKGRDANGFSTRTPAKTPSKSPASASTSKNPSKTPAAKSTTKKTFPTHAHARARSPLLAPQTNERSSRRRRRSPSPSPPPPKRSRAMKTPPPPTPPPPTHATHEEIEWIPLTVQPAALRKGARGGSSRRYYAGFTRWQAAEGAAAAVLQEFKVGDTVLLRAERSDLPPYVARLEALYEERGGAAAAAPPRAEARCRWFYRPEDTDFAMKDPREIFYSHVRGVADLPTPSSQ